VHLVETHTIKNSNVNFKRYKELCFLSKNLYNQALYEFYNTWNSSGKFPRYKELEKKLKSLEEQYDNYYKLTSSVSQQVLLLFDKNLKSYLSLIKKFKKDKKSLSGLPRPMRYKDSKNGSNVVIIRGDKYVCRFKEGYIHFPKKLNLEPVKSINVKRQEDLVQIRIVPQTSCYKLEIIYKKNEEVDDKLNNFASIDLGIDNFATLTIPNTKVVSIYSGKLIKSINKNYNKLKSKKESKLPLLSKKKKTKNGNRIQSKRSKKINLLTQKRNNKIKDKCHKISRAIINQLIKNNVKELAIGKNTGWKQKVNLGKKTNQTFVSIPFKKFIDMLIYKCKLVGINVKVTNESYTSKCSSIDLESIEKHESYVGKRIKRGLFVTKEGILINADINGSLNIGRKVFGDNFINSADIGFVLNPTKVQMKI